MGDDDASAAQFAKPLVNSALGSGIVVAQRFIEATDARVARQGASQGYSLPLTVHAISAFLRARADETIDRRSSDCIAQWLGSVS